MLDHKAESKDFKNTFAESQRRYISYFLKCAQASLSLQSQETNREIDVELPNLQNAFYLALAKNDIEVIREFWDSISGYFWYRGYWRVYFDWGESTLRALRQTGADPLSEGRLMGELGWLRMEWGDFSIAEEIFDRARKLLYIGKDQKYICIVERYIGVLAYRKGDLETAEKQYEIAERIALTINYKSSLSEIYNLQGSLARKRGNLQLARSLYQKAKELVESRGDEWRLTATLRNLAALDVQLGDLEAAKERLEQTIDLCLRADRKDMLCSCQIKLAEVEKQLDNVERAKILAISAREGFSSLEIKNGLEKTNQFLASLVQNVDR
ncbi:MAG: hypothetical protein DRJ03_15035 [Chloroflexi bacterium]|nr:MAG: hypothetical protein DRJ03_15035 [Chloroflexota bacterium]RLI53971.1 MAG: hypothetical protein DRP09_14375 [Candidatus Thorarchaeota archaeon]